MAREIFPKGGTIMAQRLNYSDGYYYGEVSNGEENGFGIFYWNSGNRYEGDWLNGQMHGFGTMYYANGDKYEGYWKEHAKHGQGAYYYADGDTQFGYWSEGSYQGFDDPDDAGYDDGGSYYDDSDDGDYSAPTARQSAARKRLRRGLGGGSSNPTKKSTQKPTRQSAPKASASSDSYSYESNKPSSGNKKGKGKLIGRIILKSICCLFGLGIIALALLQFFATKGQVAQDERIAILISQTMSGFFGCGLWLFYYGTIVALKKAGLNIRDDLKDPSFGEIITVTVTETTYSDGSKKRESESNIIAVIFLLLFKFVLVFGFIQIYYAILAPILAPISLIKDIKKLRTEY